MHLPIPWISSMADWQKDRESDSTPYFTVLFAAALFAAY